MLNFKKPQTWVAIIVIVLLVIIGISCLTNGKDAKHDAPNTQTNNSEQTSSETVSDTQDSQMQEPATETTEAPTDSANASADEVLAKGMKEWALAFSNRNLDSIKKLADQNTLNNLKEQNLLDDDNNFGWSSPWPMAELDNGLTGYSITDVDAKKNTATILYYAWVSDPHITVWAETLHYEVTDGKLKVTGEKLKMLDAISSGAEFNLAYPKGIKNTPIDYYANGMLDTLNKNAMSANGTSPDGEYNLTDPVEAARYLLNLLSDNSKVEITTDKENDDSVDLTVHFTEDDVTHHITMERPWGKDGIWVVSRIS